MAWDGKVYRAVKFGGDGTIKGAAKEAELKMLLLTREHWRSSTRPGMQDYPGLFAPSAPYWTSSYEDRPSELQALSKELNARFWKQSVCTRSDLPQA
jgi:hypothetical protein